MIDIKDTSGNIRFSTPINKGSKRKFLLMKEDYITLKFSLNDPIYFHLGDGVDNELGIFELVDLYKPVYNGKTDGYDYELRLDAYYWKWKNKKFFFTPEQAGREVSWNLTATLKKHMEVFLKNLEVLGYKYRDQVFACDIDNTVEISSKLVSYDNCNLIDALTQMAEAWECEWWITNHTINFGRCEYGDPVDFKVGDSMDSEDVNVNTMQRSDSQTRYATRIYAFGSTRNIPKTYRKKLVFDVKEVDGRNISDTARALDIKFFPSNNILGEHLKGNIDIEGSFPKEGRQYRCTIVSALAGGTYSIPKGGVPFMVSGIIGTEWHPPVGTYYYRLELCYKKDGVSHTVFSESKEYYRGDKNTDFFKDTFNLPSSIKIEKGGADLEAILTTKIQTSETRYVANANIVRFELDLLNVASSSTTSVTFISGNNKGQSYPSIYNPDFLTGDDANVIRLPEGITTSLGDMYTIDNIIKGKVPVSYFSKDDNETTINGIVQTRLMLPVDVPYVDAYPNMTQEEAIEEIVVFDDVYAKYIGTVSKAPDPKFVDEVVDNKPTGNKYPIYTIEDNGLKNFSESFHLDELRIVFQTGKLTGLDFAIDLKKDGDDAGTTFDIIPNENYGVSLPNDQLFPQAKHMEEQTEVPADTYILYGFDTAFLSEDMLPNAEKELLEKAKKYVEKSKIDPSTYNCKMVPAYVYNDRDTKTFELGDRVDLINKAYFENGRQSRIIGYECSLDIPFDQPIYIVGETAAYSRLGEIESKVDSLTYKGQRYNGISVGGGSGGTSVYVIGVNDRTLPSDRNTFSAKRIINEITERALSATDDDEASGLIKFLKGLTSEDLIHANDGLVVRKKELVEASFMSLIEESDDSLIEELDISVDPPGVTTTLGGLTNVNDDADYTSETADLLVRLAGSSEWSVNSNLFSDVDQLMSKVFPFAMNLSGGSTFEKGSSQIVNLSWTYDRVISSQSVNGEFLAIDIRTKQYIDVTADKTYTLSTVCGTQIYTKSVSIQFKLKKYYGVLADDTLTNEQILELPSQWAQQTQGSTTFDCTGGKYPYYVLPTSMISGIQFWIGGLRNTDWMEEVREITNVYGYAESYTIFRLNNIQTGVLNIEIR